jgi:hypothetical protein
MQLRRGSGRPAVSDFRFDFHWELTVDQRNAEDRKVGADHLAEVAVDTHSVFDRLWKMVSLPIEILGENQHILRAILDAKTTALAAFHDDAYFSKGDVDLIDI